MRSLSEATAIVSAASSCGEAAARSGRWPCSQPAHRPAEAGAVMPAIPRSCSTPFATGACTLALMLVAVACGQAKPEADNTLRREAKAFIAATLALRPTILPKLKAEGRRHARSFERCPLVRSTPAATLPSEQELFVLTAVTFYRVVADDYLAYARKLLAVRSRDPTLAQAAVMVARLARRYRPLKRARPDLCRVLRRWQAAGWRRPFDLRPLIGGPASILDRDGIDRSPLAEKARRAFRAASERLLELGATPRQALMFRAAADFFLGAAASPPRR
jgi:hypothetical protein